MINLSRIIGKRIEIFGHSCAFLGDRILMYKTFMGERIPFAYEVVASGEGCFLPTQGKLNSSAKEYLSDFELGLVDLNSAGNSLFATVKRIPARSSLEDNYSPYGR